MFGFITPTKSNLSKSEIEKYRAYYCGLCHELKGRYGKEGAATLSYDMVFLILLLTDLYDAGIEGGFERCAARPLKEHKLSLQISFQCSAEVLRQFSPENFVHITLVNLEKPVQVTFQFRVHKYTLLNHFKFIPSPGKVTNGSVVRRS